MTETIGRVVILLLVVALAASCSGSSPSASATRVDVADVGLARTNVSRLTTSADEAALAAQAINAFAFDLYREMAPGDDNLVFSPTSIAIAFGMARAGARGETAAQMDEVLHDLAADDHAGWLSSLDALLAQRSGEFEDVNGERQAILLDIANAYFVQRGYELEPAFLDALAARFDAGVNVVDYAADLEAAVAAINGWTSERTHERIPRILAPGVLTENTRLTLVNAIYLKAPWLIPFGEEMTEDRPFRTPDGGAVDVPMMRATIGIPCATGPDWAAFTLRYVGEQLSMVAVVPDDLRAFERSVDADSFTAIVDAMELGSVDPDVSLPRFDFETEADLTQVLPGLGMRDAFVSGLADFTGITRAERLFIGTAIHKAKFTVDEKGTEAAAATLIAFPASGPPPDKCVATADRPFLFAIRDDETGAILFLGRVTDPS